MQPAVNDQSQNPFAPPAAFLEASKLFASYGKVPGWAVFKHTGECVSLAWTEEQAGVIADGVANQGGMPIAVCQINIRNFAIPDRMVEQLRTKR